ncbi:MAG: hypothetical protein ACKVJC_05350 [Flavobacteriales bacterium]
MLPEEIHNKRILISVLNWGMGHVSRCIGLINELVNQKNTLFIAGSSDQIIVFKEYFPTIQFIKHEGYPFKFSHAGNFSLNLLKQSGELKKRKNLEQQEVEAYVNKFGIDCILSDHRYGFFSDTTHSIFITHQLNLPVRKPEFLVDQLHLKLMKKFDEVWVMDYANNRLAGKLSKVRKGVSLSYIGPYSRFSIYDKDSLKVGHTVVISSGPLIYAQQFLDQCLLKLDNENTIVVAPKEMNISQDFTHISESWGEQDKVIMAAKKIVSKSGYSTIMDLDYLKTEHQLYTTKGQREQEYLYKVHSNGKKLL